MLSLSLNNEVIADFSRGLGSDRTARVDTRYKTVDRKVRPVAAPLPEGSGFRMKGVASDPCFRDPDEPTEETGSARTTPKEPEKPVRPQPS